MATKTTVYLPDDLKARIGQEARRRGVPEAEVIRRAIADSLTRPAPRAGLFSATPFAEDLDAALEGFGDR